ncbi:hypothetical protein PPERSA_05377 [Pseudocohnilembus persalinus]|uniref:Uncharacterized protein n=1 Tax=Pseudocohnilembus persalinus TaxID=266149 RepID=A0A0V0R7S4_PSEPJ|nr:hypothetical protein PPERSA_05377 [Pseudocohnilembus persalinus]|eukprot:KRX10557.1 hypothetical protein PPERSA_05377 [Pseudocohnilembus persalinus]
MEFINKQNNEKRYRSKKLGRISSFLAKSRQGLTGRTGRSSIIYSGTSNGIQGQQDNSVMQESESIQYNQNSKKTQEYIDLGNGSNSEIQNNNNLSGDLNIDSFDNSPGGRKLSIDQEAQFLMQNLDQFTKMLQGKSQQKFFGKRLSFLSNNIDNKNNEQNQNQQANSIWKLIFHKRRNSAKVLKNNNNNEQSQSQKQILKSVNQIDFNSNNQNQNIHLEQEFEEDSSQDIQGKSKFFQKQSQNNIFQLKKLDSFYFKNQHKQKEQHLNLNLNQFLPSYLQNHGHQQSVAHLYNIRKFQNKNEVLSQYVEKSYTEQVEQHLLTDNQYLKKQKSLENQDIQQHFSINKQVDGQKCISPKNSGNFTNKNLNKKISISALQAFANNNNKKEIIQKFIGKKSFQKNNENFSESLGSVGQSRNSNRIQKYISHQQQNVNYPFNQNNSGRNYPVYSSSNYNSWHNTQSQFFQPNQQSQFQNIDNQNYNKSLQGQEKFVQSEYNMKNQKIITVSSPKTTKPASQNKKIRNQNKKYSLNARSVNDKQKLFQQNGDLNFQNLNLKTDTNFVDQKNNNNYENENEKIQVKSVQNSVKNKNNVKFFQTSQNSSSAQTSLRNIRNQLSNKNVINENGQQKRKIGSGNFNVKCEFNLNFNQKSSDYISNFGAYKQQFLMEQQRKKGKNTKTGKNLDSPNNNNQINQKQPNYEKNSQQQSVYNYKSTNPYINNKQNSNFNKDYYVEEQNNLDFLKQKLIINGGGKGGFTSRNQSTSLSKRCIKYNYNQNSKKGHNNLNNKENKKLLYQNQQQQNSICYQKKQENDFENQVFSPFKVQEK